LKIGIYSSPGPKTCGGFEGSFRHEVQDAKTYAAWGFDYLKYDWCGGEKVYKRAEIQEAYKKMGDALKDSGRPIVYSLCEYGLEEVWKWAPSIGGNLWRMPGDVTYNNILAISYNAILASAFA
jgi:alpha-galactosidase